MNMALLARHVTSGRQKFGVTRTMLRVAAHAILAGRRVLPKERAPFLGMAGVTRIIDVLSHKHLATAPAMRIVAGSAADLHVALLGAEQMG